MHYQHIEKCYINYYKSNVVHPIKRYVDDSIASACSWAYSVVAKAFFTLYITTPLTIRQKSVNDGEIYNVVNSVSDCYKCGSF